MVALVVLVLALAAGGAQQYGIPYAINLTRRGKRLNDTSLDGDGNVTADPETLAVEAAAVVGRPVDLNAYALARMLRSEEGSQPPEVKRLLAHVALNEAAARRVSLLQLLTNSTVASRTGKFGRQRSRWAATTWSPYEIDLGVAEEVIAEGQSLDPTGGARRFVDRLAFGVQPGTGSYADLVAKWAKEGLMPARIPPAPLRLVFFRYGGASDEEAAA